MHRAHIFSGWRKPGALYFFMVKGALELVITGGLYRQHRYPFLVMRKYNGCTVITGGADRKFAGSNNFSQFWNWFFLRRGAHKNDSPSFADENSSHRFCPLRVSYWARLRHSSHFVDTIQRVGRKIRGWPIGRQKRSARLWDIAVPALRRIHSHNALHWGNSSKKSR